MVLMKKIKVYIHWLNVASRDVMMDSRQKPLILLIYEQVG